jgi:hypothetical protein
MPTKLKPLASSNTVEGLTQLVNAFYCSNDYRVNPETLAIEHPTMPTPRLTRVHRATNGRYYFVGVKP